MNFRKAVTNLDNILKTKQPQIFNSSWILINAPRVYHYVRLNHRTENDDIDWDKLTRRLNRKFQKRWIRYCQKKVRLYKDQKEIDLILNKHKNRLYVFIAPMTNIDHRLRDRIIIALVRIAQKGNVLAQRELAKWLTFIIEDWIDRYYHLRRWKGYTDLIQERIQSCIRRYRYTGSFLGYLYKTLEYSGRGICFLQKFSLDDPIFEGNERRIDYFIYDS